MPSRVYEDALKEIDKAKYYANEAGSKIGIEPWDTNTRIITLAQAITNLANVVKTLIEKSNL